MRNLLFLWKMFEWVLGLKINTKKTELHYLGPNANRANRLADILGCRVGNLPFRYLGVPLHIKTLLKEDWNPIVNRIENRIESWKAKLLSRGETHTGQLDTFEPSVILLHNIQSATMGSEPH
ncbi:hypothetical protein ACMD2_01901 [Ananas comosus]|uniref:Reverse transcriptase domain-containing protein n=1 Tax=Ananas comosus TaxID=4615 RepID=A0A199VF28_ANACO|nr:hypothetical protein ACMD2_01901 [Ananas comosus]